MLCSRGDRERNLALSHALDTTGNIDGAGAKLDRQDEVFRNVAETDRSDRYSFMICQVPLSFSWQQQDPSIPIPIGRWS